MCFGAKDETAEGKLVTRELRTFSLSGTAVTFSLRLSSGPRAMWEGIPSCGDANRLLRRSCGVHRVDRGRGFLFPPVKNCRLLS